MKQPPAFFMSTISGLLLLLIAAAGLTTETTCNTCTTEVKTWDDGTIYHKYQRGSYICSDEASIEPFKYDSNNLDNQYFYYSCLVIQGKDSEGLPQLYILSDHHSHLLASNFLASYLRTDGRLESPWTTVTVDEAIKYNMKTQAIIKLTPRYPEPYDFIEQDSQIELNSAYTLPHLYFLKYNLGIVGDYHEHLLQPSSYEGDKEKLNTFPEYNSFMRDSLNNVIRHAGECAGLPQKAHFDKDLYQAVTSACSLMKEMALSLLPLEQKRQGILLQPHCQDLNEENCAEYYDTHGEINNMLKNFKEEYDRLFENVRSAYL